MLTVTQAAGPLRADAITRLRPLTMEAGAASIALASAVDAFT